MPVTITRLQIRIKKNLHYPVWNRQLFSAENEVRENT